MTREQKILRARELREQDEERWTYPAIAQELGVVAKTVQRWLNPELAAKDLATARAWKNRNKPHLREYDRTYSETHKGTCSECGGPTDYQHDGSVCKACVSEGAREKYRELEALWCAGKTYPEICEAMGWAKGTVSVMVHRARREGYHLPYRYTTGKRAGRKFSEQVAA